MNTPHAFFKRIFIVAQLILIALISISAVNAQTSRVDPTFNALVSRGTDNLGSPVQRDFKLQPDGKIITFGNFQIVNGVLRIGIARLNADGSLDNSFNCTTCTLSVGSVLIQPDGKILIAESQVKRLNADGSLDNTFNYESNSANRVEALQPDGKIIVSKYTYSNNYNTTAIYRLNSDGTFDSTFATINLAPGRTIYETIGKVVVLPSGKIYISTNSCCSVAFTSFKRYNSDGTIDSTFERPTFSSSSTFSLYISDFEVLPDGSAIVVGNFEKVNGLDRLNVVKILPAGNVDLSFVTGNVYDTQEKASQVEIFSNGKVLISTTGLGSQFPNEITNKFVRFNTDGSTDATFVEPANLVSVRQFFIDSSDNVFLYGAFNENNQLVYKYARLNMNGGLVSSFPVYHGIGGAVSTLALQTDGKIIIAGDFLQIGAVSRKNIARLNSDGSLDETFNPGSGFTGTVNKIVVQSDGKILVGGSFSAYNGTAQNALVRLNSDGSLDSSFNAGITDANILTIAVQADGKILVGGEFNSIGGQPRPGIARLNANGNLDTGFNPVFGTGVSIYRILILPDGKILVGGSFIGVNGFTRNSLVKLNTDGSLDTTFNANGTGAVREIEITFDGKYIVLTNTVKRLNSNGTTDATFQAPTFQSDSSDIFLDAILAQPDGSVIIGGNFITVNGIARLRLARLKPDGTVDLLFNQGGANNRIRALLRQPDGKILVGGDFTSILNEVRLGVARILVNQVINRVTQFDYDGDGQADVSVFRPSNGVWYVLPSQSTSFYGVQFGRAGDKIAPADYDGDGKTDLAVFRENITGAGSTGAFYILNSSDNSFRPVAFGSTGDIPISGDWDGDGKADLAVYRDGSLTGASSLFIYRPSSQPGVDYRLINWGAAGDKPVVGDYDGDGKLDAAIFRPSITQWYILRSSNNQFFNVQFGQASDVLAPADYNGDGKTDVGVFRPSSGNWYYSSSQTTPSTNFTGIQFGVSEDLPVPADYDGDGKADIAVFRPSNGIWYIQRSTQGFTGVQFGSNSDKPTENAYVR